MSNNISQEQNYKIVKVMDNSEKSSDENFPDGRLKDDNFCDKKNDQNELPKYSSNTITGKSLFHQSNSGSANAFGSNRQVFTNSCSTVAHSVFSGGGAAQPPTCLLHNPFALRYSSPSHSISEAQTTVDTIKGDLKPILNPPTFTPSKTCANEEESGQTNLMQNNNILRPSFLSAQKDNHSSLSGFKIENSSSLEAKENGKFHSSLEDTCEANYSNASDSISSRISDQEIVHENIFTKFCKAVENNASTECSNNVDFVFGTNMDERVVNIPVSLSTSNGCVSNGTTKFCFTENNAPHSISSDVDKKEYSSHHSSEACIDKSQTLEDSARQYEARKAKPIFETVTVVTGEEEESNVLQANCKLYVFDKCKQSWLEKGRGLLRLNDKETQDKEELQSRLVMRTQGSLRVVLNTKIWPGMNVERASDKSIRITAMDTDGLKVFLIMASPKDADQIFSAIDWRVQSLKVSEDRKGSNKRSLQEELDERSEPLIIKKVKFEPVDSSLLNKKAIDNASGDLCSKTEADSDKSASAPLVMSP